VPRSYFAKNLGIAVCITAAIFLFPALSYAQAPVQTPAPVPSATSALRQVTDEAGRTVRIPQTPHRIVSLAPGLTETIYALGLQDLLVGDTDYCDFPPDAQRKPKVGGAINPSLEAIADLHPDLVLVTKSLNRLDTVNSLANLGIPSYAIDPQSVAAIISSTQRLAEIMGAPEAGEALAKDLERHLAGIQRRVAPFPRRTALFIVWTQPLISVGKQTFIADALHYAGAVSIVDSAENWPKVSLEEVARLQPEFLVFPDTHTETTPLNIEALSDLPGWRILNAVRNHRYAKTSDAVDRPAPRIVSAIEQLARQFHPEAFPENPVASHSETRQKGLDCTDEASALTSSPQAARSQIAARPDQCHPESPRLLRGEGSAFPSPQPHNVLSSLAASRCLYLLEECPCAR
jgi:iron complex transport system substrate-binding protein